MSFLSPIASRLGERFGATTTADHLDSLMACNEIKIALDIGCGIKSTLTKYRPLVTTVGLDSYTITEASKSDAHDYYISADITQLSTEEIQKRLHAVCGRSKAVLVTLFGVIEHLPKQQGWLLLDKIEHLSERFLLIDTPNSFVEQGPEYGNPYQRHLSGWFPHDFQGYGYSVY